jgi:hypothetical protein
LDGKRVAGLSITVIAESFRGDEPGFLRLGRFQPSFGLAASIEQKRYAIWHTFQLFTMDKGGTQY